MSKRGKQHAARQAAQLVACRMMGHGGSTASWNEFSNSTSWRYFCHECEIYVESQRDWRKRVALAKEAEKAETDRLGTGRM